GPPREAEYDQATEHGWTKPAAGSLIQLVLHEDRATRDHELARLEPLANLQAPVLLHPNSDLAAPQDQRLLLDPDHGLLALPDTRLGRDRGRILACIGRDLEARKHFRLEDVTGVGDFRTDNDPTRGSVRCRADCDDLRVEHAVRQGRDLDLEL